MSPTNLDSIAERQQEDYLNELPDEVEMSLFDHLEELRLRIFYALIAVAIAAIGCFIFVRPLVRICKYQPREFNSYS